MESKDSSMHILVIDDEKYIREMLSDALSFQNYKVQTAEDGLKGLKLFKRQGNFGVVLTDLLMPQMNGMDFLEHAKKIDPYVEVILLTGFGTNETVIDALKKGAFDYLQKPTNIDELFLTVRRAIERRRLYEENRQYQANLERLVKELEHQNKELENTLRKLSETQSQLVQSEKLASLGQLAAGVAHEINNPVGFVLSNLNSMKKFMGRIHKVLDFIHTEVMEKSGADLGNQIKSIWNRQKIEIILPEIANIIEESIEGSNRVKTIVQDLKNFSNLDRAQITLADIPAAIESTLNIARNAIKYKAEVIKEFEDIPPIKCNLQQINQVFLNIIVNAGQAIHKPGGKIYLRTRREDDLHIRVEIEDNGIGIKKENLNKIFDPFYTTKEVGSGTGLGLTISYRIIKEHGGEILVDSEVGRGTKFSLILPIEGVPEEGGNE